MTKTVPGRRPKASSKAAPKAASKRATSMLILSSKAGSMTPAIEAKLRKSFPRSVVMEFDPRMDIDSMVSPKATIIVAGGDGTIGWVVRRLAETRHPLGILSMGTFNNFAKSLGLPTNVNSAIRVVQTGRPRAITLGRVNDTIFLEAAAIGLFGEFITAGESAKDRAFGQFAEDLKHIAEAKPFTYELTGDIRGSGTAMSLVFTNTSSTGAQMPVSDKTPVDPYLELSVHAGATRSDIARRVLARVVLSKHKEGGLGQVFKFRKLVVTAKPNVRIYADNAKVGRTPAVITAELSALKVILPK
jgi:diacylglycerol kinase family enzyme